MKLNFVCLLAIFLFGIQPILGQTQFTHFVLHPDIPVGREIILLSGGGYIVNSSDISTPSISKIDSSGQIEWTKHTYSVMGMTESANGDFLVITQDNSGMGSHPLYFTQMDPAGNVIWEYRVMVSSHQAVKADQAPNGDYVIALQENVSNPVIRIIRISAGGSHVWSRQILLDTNEFTIGFRLQQLLISPISGRIALLMPSSETYGNFLVNHPTLILLDPMGNFQWSVSTDLLYYSYGFELWQSVDFDQNDDLVVAGVDGFSITHCPGMNNSYISNFFVRKIRNGNIINHINVGVTGNGFDYSEAQCKVLPNGKYGVWVGGHDIFGSPNYRNRFYEMDSFGNVLYRTELNVPANSISYGSAMTSFGLKDDSTVVMWGNRYDSLAGVGFRKMHQLIQFNYRNPHCLSPAPVTYFPGSVCHQFMHLPMTMVSTSTAFTVGSGVFLPITLAAEGVCTNVCPPSLRPFTATQDSGLGMHFYTSVALHPGDSLYWDFGDGFSGTGVNPYHVYGTVGTYTVCMIRYSPGCGLDTLCQQVILTECTPVGIVPLVGTLCAGDTLVFSADGPSPGTYSWYWDGVLQGNDSTQIMPAVPPGLHLIVLETQSLNCLMRDSLSVLVRFAPALYLPDTSSTCTGTAYLSIPNHPSILWSNGATTHTLYAQPGTYSVTVTNSFGCSKSDTTEVVAFLPSPFSLGPDTVVCGSFIFANLAAPVGFSNYAWSNYDTTRVTTVFSPGTYLVSATDSNGCYVQDSIRVINPPLPVVNLGPNITACGGTAPVLTAPGGMAGYVWSNGATTQSTSVTAQGTYWVTVTDTFGCSGSDNIQVNFLPVFNFSLGPDMLVCNSSSVTLNGPTALASYAWNTGATTQAITVNGSGSYILTGMDYNNCVDSDTIQVQFQSGALPVNLGPDLQLCSGESTTLTGPSGMSGYQWSNGANASQISVSQPGIYSLTVTAGMGCTGSDTMVVGYFAPIGLTLGADRPLCAGSTATLSGPMGMAGYLWSMGDTVSQILASQPGTYSLTVTDANGCSESDTLNLIYSPAPTVNLGPDLQLCSGASVTLSGPLGMAAYQWSNGSNTSQIMASQPGSYSLTVTDGIGCTGSDTVVISAGPAAPVAAFAMVQVGDSVSLSYSGSGSSVNLFWDFGDGYTSTVANPTHSFANPGNYTVCLTASNLCGSDTLCQTVLVVGTNDAWTDGSVLVYPNPANGEFDIRLEFSSVEETQIEVYNAVGQLVAEWKLGRVAGWQARCNATLWSAGVYALRVRHGERVWVERLRVID